METVVNQYRVRVKRQCGSCGLKAIDDEGERICTAMQLKVGQQFVCPLWRMSEGLMNAGRWGGVVRLKGTQIVVIK